MNAKQPIGYPNEIICKLDTLPNLIRILILSRLLLQNHMDLDWRWPTVIEYILVLLRVGRGPFCLVHFGSMEGLRFLRSAFYHASKAKNFVISLLCVIVRLCRYR